MAEGGALTWNFLFVNEVVPTDADYIRTVPKKEGQTWNELLYLLSQLLSKQRCPYYEQVGSQGI